MSLPIVWLLFAWKRGVKLYDHVVFTLYSISFMSLLFVGYSLLNLTGLELHPAFGALAIVIPLAHIYAQVKGAYALSWGSAAWRTLALSFGAVLVLSLFFTMILLMGLLD
jgi:hypothetical protein